MPAHRVLREEKLRNKRLRDRANEIRCKAWANALLGGACVVCGETDRDVLEFDHRNGDGDQEGTPHKRRKGGGGFFARIRADFNRFGEGYTKLKWQILCASCHRKKTRVERDHLPSKQRRALLIAERAAAQQRARSIAVRSGSFSTKI